MKTGMGLVLIGIGAILAFAVTTNTSVFNLHTAGYVIMIIGVLGLAVPRRGYGWVGRRLWVRQGRWRPGNRIEEVVTYPSEVSRNPANTRMRAGLPAPGAWGSPEAAAHVGASRYRSTEAAGPALDTEAMGPRPGETEIIEDVYEQ